ncbi:hypothetical protein BD626DRAFT_122863 [Schizophyllum amplum]|uniref:Protein kinase domain-containing protein n=1 Tax=Schizophyllum amplum TaxID=97359 RepID=A0A550C7S2_9AGAR|nr:hypothetical protein BD626DRAFT_122863 [Auriculariopsis ampla]
MDSRRDSCHNLIPVIHHSQGDSSSTARINLQSHVYPYSPLPLPITQILPTRHTVNKSSVLDIEHTSVKASGIIQGLFSNDRFAASFTPSSIVAALNKVLYDVKKGVWLRYPDPSPPASCAQRAVAIVKFLNDFTRCCWGAYADKGLPLPACARQWTVAESTRITSTGDSAQVTGIVLSDAHLGTVQWSDVLCDMQMAPTADLMPEVLERLSVGAASVFQTQDDRLFHVGIALAGNDFQLAYFDRAGRVLSGAYDIHATPVPFARIIMGLTVLDKSCGGKDSSIASRDGKRFVAVDGVEYEIVETLSVARNIRGRGTVCWRCRRPDSDEDFVIRNIWADMDGRPSEGELLKRVLGIPGIADFVGKETVLAADGQKRSTTWVRYVCRGPASRSEQELRRLVLRPYARPLHEFSSKDELLSVLRDAIEAHGDLYEHGDLLHCDISDNNVMIRPQRAGSNLRRGVLIDLDCAVKVSEIPGKRKQGFAPRRTGTVPFMACEVLWDCVHRGPWHDLESFLYVLMIICTSYSGPSDTPRKDFDIYQSPLGPWYEGDGGHKSRIMRKFDDNAFRAFLDSAFDPYFDDLKDLVCDLRTLILHTWDDEVGERRLACHADVLCVFDRYIRARQTTLAICSDTKTKTSRSPSVDGDKDVERRKRKRGGVHQQTPENAKPRATRTRSKAAAESSSEYSDDSERTLVAHGRPSKKAKTVADTESFVAWERNPHTGRLTRCWKQRKADRIA